MPNQQHVEILKSGVGAWNHWRENNPDIKPDLSGAILNGANLANANLAGVDLSEARLRNATLTDADLTEATLIKAELGGADLTRCNLSYADIRYMVYPPRDMRKKFCGIRGLNTCYGNVLFQSYAADQDYLDSLEGCLSKWQLRLFDLWWLLGYGRSLWRVMVLSVLIIVLFGAIYATNPEIIRANTANQPETWFTPYYYSTVIFTTLGFGNLAPNSLLGEFLVTLEVLLGYLTLGLLIAILVRTITPR